MLAALTTRILKRVSEVRVHCFLAWTRERGTRSSLEVGYEKQWLGKNGERVDIIG